MYKEDLVRIDTRWLRLVVYKQRIRDVEDNLVSRGFRLYVEIPFRGKRYITNLNFDTFVQQGRI